MTIVVFTGVPRGPFHILHLNLNKLHDMLTYRDIKSHQMSVILSTVFIHKSSMDGGHFEYRDASGSYICI